MCIRGTGRDLQPMCCKRRATLMDQLLYARSEMLVVTSQGFSNDDEAWTRVAWLIERTDSGLPSAAWSVTPRASSTPKLAT